MIGVAQLRIGENRPNRRDIVKVDKQISILIEMFVKLCENVTLISSTRPFLRNGLVEWWNCLMVGLKMSR